MTPSHGQAARAAEEASKQQAELIQQQAQDAVAKARAEKEEALLSVRREMEEQHAAKVKKYQAMIEEVKAERDERYHELQQELQSEVAIRGYALSCALQPIQRLTRLSGTGLQATLFAAGSLAAAGRHPSRVAARLEGGWRGVAWVSVPELCQSFAIRGKL